MLLICGTAVYAPSYALDFSLELLGAGAATPGAGHILQGYVGDCSLTARSVAVGCRGLGLGWNNNADSSFSLISALLVPRVSVYPLVVLDDERAIMLEIYSEYNWYREAMNARTAAVGIKARYNRGAWGLAILGSRVFRFGSGKTVRSERTVESLLRMWSIVDYNDAEVLAIKQLAKLGCLRVRTVEIGSIKTRKLQYRIPQATVREVVPGTWLATGEASEAVVVCTEKIRKSVQESELIFLGISRRSR